MVLTLTPDGQDTAAETEQTKRPRLQTVIAWQACIGRTGTFQGNNKVYTAETAGKIITMSVHLPIVAWP